MVLVSVVVWLLLIVLSALFLAMLGRSAFRKAKGLLAEIGTASKRLSDVSDQLQELPGQPDAPKSTVFDDPQELRREQALAGRRSGRSRQRPR